MKRTFFEFIKRDLLLGIIVTVLVFASALAWGGPFLASSQQPADPAAGQSLAQAAIPSAK
jgi:hypothetical protein